MAKISLFSFCLLAAGAAAEKPSLPLLRRGGAPAQIECTPYLLLGAGVQDGAGKVDKWVCETSEGDEPSGTPFVYDFQGLDQTYFEKNEIVSGKDSITMSVANKWKGRGNMPDTITVTPGAGVTINRGFGAGNRGKLKGKGNSRNLASKTGTSRVLVVRVSTPDSTENPERSAKELSSDCFGLGSPDEVQMVSRFEACSGGLLKLKAASDTAVITNGVVDVKIDITVTGKESYNTIENAARTATVAKVGSLSQWDFVIFTWSKRAAWNGAAAYAYVAGSISCFDDSYIYKMGIQVHELGHNLGLGHSGVKRTYDDHSCLMGNPSNADDMHAMCFNGAKSFELGWYSSNNGYKTSDPILSGNLVGAKLAALDDYLTGKTRAEHSVVLKIDVDPTVDLDDYYVMYNRKKGVNSQVVGYADEVTITKGRKSQTSTLVGHLSPSGESKWELPNFGGGNVPLVVELCEVVDDASAVDYARLNVFLNDGSPNVPTCTEVEDEKPSASPSIAPSVAPSLAPSFAPSNRPSSFPSIAPSSLPSSLPSIAPSSRPSSLPSNAPTSLPSSLPSMAPAKPTRSPASSPTSSPTDIPTSSPTAGPTSSPSSSLTSSPTSIPKVGPTSNSPTSSPTRSPTQSPPGEGERAPSESPTSLAPRLSTPPTSSPTASPTSEPISSPTSNPISESMSSPTSSATSTPTTSSPSSSPMASPTSRPISNKASSSTTFAPTSTSTPKPTHSPTSAPTTASPTMVPTLTPTSVTPPFSCSSLNGLSRKVCQTAGCTFSKGICSSKNSGLPAPVPSPPGCMPSGPCITKLVLVNALNDVVLRDLTNGDTIDISVTGNSIAIEAKATNAQMVQFDLDAVINYRTEFVAPYMMNGDNNGDYFPWSYTLGPHTLSVKATNAAGTVSPPYVINFTVVALAAPIPEPAPAPVPAPVPAPTS